MLLETHQSPRGTCIDVGMMTALNKAGSLRIGAIGQASVPLKYIRILLHS